METNNSKTLNPTIDHNHNNNNNNNNMAGNSSTLESNPSSYSDDEIIKTIQQTIDSHLGFIPKPTFLNPSHQTNNTHVTNSTNLSAKHEKAESFIKKQRKPRKRGKRNLNNNNNNNNDDDDFERQTFCDCDKRGDKIRVMYVKEDMEGLRYVGTDEQKKKWIEVYCGMGSDVAKEYDSLVVRFNKNVVDDDHMKEDGCYVSFDPRPLFPCKKGNKPDNAGSEMQSTNQMDHVAGVNGSDVDGSFGGEDYYEDEDSDSEYVGIQRPAFYVSGEPDFDSGPPQDGLEYLRRVRWETEHIPKVKVAKVDISVLNKEQTVYMPSIPDIAACPEHLMPSEEWEDVFLADFSKLRLTITQDESYASTFSGEIESLPLAENIVESVIQENLDFCQIDDQTSMFQDNLDCNQTEDKTTICDWPSLGTILEMEPVARVTMLRKRITTMETKSSLCRADCAWLFALCAAIDTPLNADTSASLRCLLRKCATLRAEKTSLDDEVIMLNILVTISGKYFGQLETK